MNKKVITAKLRAGWELVNRGSGWWLTTPSLRGLKFRSKFIGENLIVDFVNEGFLIVEKQNRIFVARLAEDDKTDDNN